MHSDLHTDTISLRDCWSWPATCPTDCDSVARTAHSCMVPTGRKLAVRDGQQDHFVQRGDTHAS